MFTWTTVFVEGDWGRWTGGGHMQADTLEELHAMADRLGLRRAWFQTKPGKPWHDHYDLTRQLREQAIPAGRRPGHLAPGGAAASPPTARRCGRRGA